MTTEKEKCIICGEEDQIILHDDKGVSYCPEHFTEHVGYCSICQQPSNIAHNFKNPKGEIYCHTCIQKGSDFADKMRSIIDLQQKLEKYDIKLPLDDSMIKLDIKDLQDLKFAMTKIYSLISKIEE